MFEKRFARLLDAAVYGAQMRALITANMPTDND
jgi:hypothetical protein